MIALKIWLSENRVPPNPFFPSFSSMFPMKMQVCIFLDQVFCCHTTPQAVEPRPQLLLKIAGALLFLSQSNGWSSLSPGVPMIPVTSNQWFCWFNTWLENHHFLVCQSPEVCQDQEPSPPQWSRPLPWSRLFHSSKIKHAHQASIDR